MLSPILGDVDFNEASFGLVYLDRELYEHTTHLNPFSSVLVRYRGIVGSEFGIK